MRRPGFTLVELLIVIAIIAIIAGMSMAALLGAAEEGRRSRARSQIAKLDQLISEKWNGYRYRQLPVRIPNNTPPTVAARRRLDVMRELMRMEMPDRLTDVLDDPVTGQSIPASLRAYRRYFNATSAASNASYEQAECLYAIVAQIRDGDKSALEFFAASEIGDVDGDNAYEILDPWGQPVMFLRWAPGYSRATMNDELAGVLTPPSPQPSVAVSTFQLPDGNLKPDTFDPLKADPRWTVNAGFKPFQIRPLIFSGGPDKIYDIYTDDEDPALKIRYAATNPTNDPYFVKIVDGQPMWVGSPIDYTRGDPQPDGLNHGDNITNHGLEFEGE